MSVLESIVLLQKCFKSQNGIFCVLGLKNPKQHKRGVATAKYHRGRILADLKLFDEAIEVYREAVETRPDNFAPQSLYNVLGMKTQGSEAHVLIVNTRVYG